MGFELLPPTQLVWREVRLAKVESSRWNAVFPVYQHPFVDPPENLGRGSDFSPSREGVPDVGIQRVLLRCGPASNLG